MAKDFENTMNEIGSCFFCFGAIYDVQPRVQRFIPKDNCDKFYHMECFEKLFVEPCKKQPKNETCKGCDIEIKSEFHAELVSPTYDYCRYWHIECWRICHNW